jgi:hypothetical protein
MAREPVAERRGERFVLLLQREVHASPVPDVVVAPDIGVTLVGPG